MKKRIPSFLMGVVATVMVLTLSLTALAATGAITIEVAPIDVLVDGKVFQPKDANGNDVMVFVHNGTTYAPLRALAEAYGLEVGYDGEKRVATVSQPGKPNVANSTVSPSAQDINRDSFDLVSMDYSEFKSLLSIRREVGSKLSQTEGRSEAAELYIIELELSYDVDVSVFAEAWKRFHNSERFEVFLNQALTDYATLAPYNSIMVMIFDGSDGSIVLASKTLWVY